MRGCRRSRLTLLAVSAALTTLLTACSPTVQGTSTSPSAGVATATVTPPPCTASWASLLLPLPQGANPAPARPGHGYRPGTVLGLDGSSATALWAVGSYSDARGTERTLTERWDGSIWTIVPSPDVDASVTSKAGRDAPGDRLTGVRVLAPDNVWAVGSYSVQVVTPATPATPYVQTSIVSRTLVLHWTGTAWSVVPAPDQGSDDGLTAISGSSAGDLWAAGTSTYSLDSALHLPQPQVTVPLIEHWNGSKWSIVRAALPGLDPTDAAAVAALAAQSHPKLVGGGLSAIHVVGRSDVWAAGGSITDVFDSAQVSQTLTEHWDGQRWTIVAAPDVYIAESEAGAADTLLAISGVSSTDQWAVGSAPPLGTVALHWNGSRWTLVPSPQTGGSGYLASLAAIAGNDVWAAGNVISHWNGQSWSEIASVNGRPVPPLHAVHAVSASDVWMAGATVFLHYRCA